MTTLSFNMCCLYWKKVSILIKPKPHLPVEYMLVKKHVYTVSMFLLYYNLMKESYFIGTCIYYLHQEVLLS